jgi:uracil-DNA glycosylase
MQVEIEKRWKDMLKDHLQKEGFKNLADFVKNEYKTKEIYPEAKNIFRSLSLTPLEKVKVVIIGQDPYPREGEADGLSFSVKKGLKIPSGLKNIFKEIEREYGAKPLALTKHQGDLSSWAEQGVLLLNSILTVEAGKPGSHKHIGWEELTNEVISRVSDKGGVVFMLWGSVARQKKAQINPEKNLILEANHPSQPSRYSIFAGNNHFKRANEWLKSKGLDEIVW